MKYLSLRKILVVSLVLIVVYPASSQKQSDLDRLYWNGKERITLSDFGIQSQDKKSGLSAAAFSLEYNVHGLSFATKNFNKRVRHYMARSASQITLDKDVKQYIRYQQTLFDIQEIYVRKFRKALRDNRKKFFLRTAYADELKEQIIGIDLPHRQAEYNNHTNSGKNLLLQAEWEKSIQKELYILGDYAYEQ